MKIEEINTKFTQNTQLYRFEVKDSVSQSYLIYLPKGWSKKSKIYICIHGISRKNMTQIQLLKSHALKNDVILIAPLFSTVYHPAYQRLETGLDGMRSDEVLNNIISDIENRLMLKIEKFTLFGFSAGAQFSHRYALCYPQKINKLVVCSAGWYTFFNSSLPFPYGIMENTEKKFLLNINDDNIYNFLNIPITVIVGELDRSLDSSLNSSKRINETQGFTRVERGVCWTKLLVDECDVRNIVPNIKFILLKKSGHSFSECVRFGGLTNYLF